MYNNEFAHQKTISFSIQETHKFLQRTCAVIQAAFAAFWTLRFGLALDSMALAVILPLILLGAIVLLSSQVKLSIHRPGKDPISQSMMRNLNIMTVMQLIASGILPFIVPTNWILASIMITIGMLLIGIFVVLRSPPLIVSGPLLVIIPSLLALTVSSPDVYVALVGAICLTGSSIGILAKLISEQKVERTKINVEMA